MKVCPYCGSTDYCVTHDPITMNNDYHCRMCHENFYEPIEWGDYRNLVKKNEHPIVMVESIGEHYAAKLRSAADDLQYCAYDAQSQNLAHHLKLICDIIAAYMERKG